MTVMCGEVVVCDECSDLAYPRCPGCGGEVHPECCTQCIELPFDAPPRPTVLVVSALLCDVG